MLIFESNLVCKARLGADLGNWLIPWRFIDRDRRESDIRLWLTLLTLVCGLVT